jgi:hypothetical protein
MADFASAFLARDQSTATDFEDERTVTTGLWPVRALVGKETAHRSMATGGLSKLVRVWKSLQDWIVPRRPEVFDYATKDRI